MSIPDDPCSICCHKTRNALAAVVHLAKHVRAENPTMASVMLDAAIKRLDDHLERCTELMGVE
jgi:hypothetical protein